MTICEKLKLNSPHEIHLFKEGAFWVAYEESAYSICKIKPYKATRKFIKVVGMDVVSIGFPDNALAMLRQGLTLSQQSETHVVLQIEEAVEAFEEWKAGVELRLEGTKARKHEGAMLRLRSATGSATGEEEKGEEVHVGLWSVVERIKGFDLSNATPMESMMFIQTLKKYCYGIV